MEDSSDILLCDLDAFYASVEQRDNPRLRGKPVIVGGSPESRGVVATCSYEARRFGVCSAMPMKRALFLCPEAVLLKPDMKRYAAESYMVKQIFENFTPQIEPVSIDEAYLNLPAGTGLEKGPAIRAAVRNQAGLPLSIGVSKNKLLAKIACEEIKPDNIGAIWPEEVETRLWPMPVSVLPGIGPASADKLLRLGVKTVGDLASCPEITLKQLLGRNAGQLAGFARGKDKRPLVCSRDLKSISEETTFSADIADPAYMLAVLQQLSAGVGYSLRKKELTAATVTLKLRFKDFTTVSRSKTLTAPTDDDKEIFQTAEALFIKHRGSGPWRLVGVQVSNLETGTQLSLFSMTGEKAKQRELLSAGDRLREKYGSDVLFNARKLTVKKEDL